MIQNIKNENNVINFQSYNYKFYLSALNKKRTDSEHGEYRPLSASEVSKDSNCKTIQDLLEEEHRIAGNSDKNKFNTRGLGKTKRDSDLLLSTEGLVKIYEERRVVDGIDVEVKEKEIVGLLGPNGAGKTTSFYMIVGLVRPDAGEVLFGSRNVTLMPMHLRARLGIGYLPQEESIFRKLTVYENIMAVLETMNFGKSEMKDRCHALMKRFGFDKLANNRAITLSGGEKRRLTIARSLVSSPKLLMLDEPVSGVDPIAVGEIQEIVSQVREEGLSILITDHNVRETLGIGDRAYMIYE